MRFLDADSCFFGFVISTFKTGPGLRWGIGYQVSGIRYGVSGMGYGVWGMGYGVWGIGYRD